MILILLGLRRAIYICNKTSRNEEWFFSTIVVDVELDEDLPYAKAQPRYPMPGYAVFADDVCDAGLRQSDAQFPHIGSQGGQRATNVCAQVRVL